MATTIWVNRSNLYETKLHEGPLPELGDGERVRQAHHRTHRRGDGGEQELLAGVETELRPEEEHERRPHAPDREPDVLGED